MSSRLFMLCALIYQLSRRRFKLKFPVGVRSGMTSQTTRQSTDMVSKRTALRRKIIALRQVQAIYTPAVPARVAAHAQLSSPTSDTPSAPRPTSVAADDTRVPDRPEDEPLFFPSQLPDDQLITATPGIKTIEERLRDAQLYDSLDRLRVQLHVKARLVTFKNRQVRHQGPNTRARKLIDTNEDKIKIISEKYRAARAAKYALTNGGAWEAVWCPLQPTDIRTMLAEDDPVNVRNAGEQNGGAEPSVLSEGRRKPSWIWMAADRESIDGDVERGIQDGK